MRRVLLNPVRCDPTLDDAIWTIQKQLASGPDDYFAQLLATTTFGDFVNELCFRWSVCSSRRNGSIVREDAGVRHYVRGNRGQPRATVRVAMRQSGNCREQIGQDFRDVGQASPLCITASVVTVMDFR